MVLNDGKSSEGVGLVLGYSVVDVIVLGEGDYQEWLKPDDGVKAVSLHEFKGGGVKCPGSWLITWGARDKANYQMSQLNCFW